MISSDERAAAHRAGHSTPELRRRRVEHQETAQAIVQTVPSSETPVVAVGYFSLSGSTITLQNPGEGFTGEFFTDGFSYVNLKFNNPNNLTTQELRYVVSCDEPTLIREDQISGVGALSSYSNFVYLRSIAHANWNNQLSVQIYENG